MNEKKWMSKKEFGGRMRELVQEHMGEEYRISLRYVKKNNGVKWVGLLAAPRDCNISPTIYLEKFYEEYRLGKGLEEIEREIVRALRRGMPNGDFDLEFFTDFDIVKQRICYRLINAKKNQGLLREIPYIPLLDLAICFYYPIEDDRIGKGSILIRNSHVQLWNTTVQQLWRAAAENTERLLPPECCSMEKIMLEMAGRKSCMEHSGDLPEKSGIPMHILTNHDRIFGAAVILYDRYLERVAAHMGCSFYLLPSSIHEVIILPKEDDRDGARLKEIIGEVNAMELDREEVLSDSLYYYDKRNKRICLMESVEG